ncbi:MAG: RNA polymerase sigma factor [Muribaculaceae bacterium]|nr:RNA polymerase sigma factor [Muribaculaceae bacterium]
MFKKSNRDRVSKIIESNLDYLVRFAYFRLGNRAEAEDLVYDAILKFLEKDSEDIKPRSVRLYLFRIVYNLCQDKIQTEKINLTLNENLNLEDFAEEPLDLEEADRINSYLESLDPREGEIIRMNVIDNLSFVEISNILGIPQSTAKSRYKAGMERLRKLFFNDKMS